jgi:molecular chaperone GrpE
VSEDAKTDSPGVRVVDRRWWARGENAGADDSASRKPTYVEELERRLADQAAQFQSFMAEQRRSLDEFEQSRVRMRREVAREVDRGKRAVLAELLDVVDNLDRALAAAQPSTGSPEPAAAGAVAHSALIRGVELVRSQFLAKLEGFGATRVPALGEAFDARRHEAVATRPVADPAQDGVVVAVLKEGFAIGDDLLRPASVVVGKHDGQA